MAPGTSGTVGLLTLTTTDATGVSFSGASVGSRSTSLIDLDGAAADRLTINGSLDLLSAYDQISFNSVAAPTASPYTLVSHTGTFDSMLTVPSGYSLSYGVGEIDLVAVLEPSTLVSGVLLIGLLGWQIRRRRRAA